MAPGTQAALSAIMTAYMGHRHKAGFRLVAPSPLAAQDARMRSLGTAWAILVYWGSDFEVGEQIV